LVPPEAQNGDAVVAVNGQDKKKPGSPQPPHVKLDGSEPVTVNASAESAAKYFEDAVTRAKALLSEGALLWEVLHVATLAQEAFILLQIVSLPWTSKSAKVKKSDHPIVDSLKTVSGQAATQLRDLAATLEAFAKTEGAPEKREVFVKDAAALETVDPALSAQYAESVAKLTLEARKEVVGGIAKGLRKVVTGH